jgi:hypothetical protein
MTTDFRQGDHVVHRGQRYTLKKVSPAGKICVTDDAFVDPDGYWHYFHHDEPMLVDGDDRRDLHYHSEVVFMLRNYAMCSGASGEPELIERSRLRPFRDPAPERVPIVLEALDKGGIVDGLTYIAIMECERAVKQAIANTPQIDASAPLFDTCFANLFDSYLREYEQRYLGLSR